MRLALDNGKVTAYPDTGIVRVLMDDANGVPPNAISSGAHRIRLSRSPPHRCSRPAPN
jgi:hypothetical protein